MNTDQQFQYQIIEKYGDFSSWWNSNEFKEFTIKQNLKEIEDAKLQNPNGSICAFCGKENDYADDCGWWYLSVDPIDHTKIKRDGMYVSCKACLHGLPGRTHRETFGVGER